MTELPPTPSKCQGGQPKDNNDSSITFPSFGDDGGNGSNPGGNPGGSHNFGGNRPPVAPHPTNPSSEEQNPGSTLKFTIKPKDPPSFHGKANEDVVTWLNKVKDYYYLTGADERTKVAFTPTLLLDAAGDWWDRLLQKHGGVRPESFARLCELMEDRFGSDTRVQRARADLRNIKQGNESVRAYASRFEALLSKLPSYDEDWAKSQFIWGLKQRVAELVTIAQPENLSAAIKKAEHVHMAQQFTQPDQPVQNRQSFYRGRGRGNRGRFAQMQPSIANEDTGTSNAEAQFSRGRGFFRGQRRGLRGQGRRIQADQCRQCYGYGHWASDCPSRATRGHRGGRCGRGRG